MMPCSFSARIALAGWFCLYGAAGSGQNSVDIALVQGQPGQLDVRMRFQNAFDGFFAASVFTVRWSEASQVTIGAPQQDAEVLGYHDVNTSGPVIGNDGYLYQVYAGFGVSVLSDIPLTLPGGEWITLCSLPVSGPSDATISADAFTSAINGQFYISLGGQESQGEIIDLGSGYAGIDGAPSISVFPTITSDIVHIVVDDRLAPCDGMVRLTDAVGRELDSARIAGGPCTGALHFDLSGYPVGIYVVHNGTQGTRAAHRVVKR